MCSNILCLPPDIVDLIYFYILASANVMNCLIALASIYLVLRNCCAPAARPTTDDPKPQIETEPVSVIVPCYLPNEQTIIESTIWHILTKLEWHGRLTLFVVYNTPAPLPFEATLRELDGREYAPGRVLRVVNAAGSTSKAQNINLVLPRVQDDYVALYDADHHPDVSSLRMLMNTMALRRACVAVQGSTYIRNARASVLAHLVDAEFFVTHFVYFPAMEVLAASGYFGGSNALWRTAVLSQYAFDDAMLTEDVDVSARALLDGHTITFCPEARSGELSPAGTRALVQQRLRWFMGWEQVTTKYYWKVFWTGLPLYRKLGFCYLFHLRWLLLLAAVLAAVINPVLTSPLIYPLTTWSLPIQICVYVAVSLYAFVALLGLSHALKHEWRRPWAIVSLVVFFLFGWLYVILHFATHTVAFIKVFTGSTGKWEVTARSIKGISPQVAPMASAQEIRVASGGDYSCSSSTSWWRWKVPVAGSSSTPLAEPLLGMAERGASGSMPAPTRTVPGIQPAS